MVEENRLQFVTSARMKELAKAGSIDGYGLFKDCINTEVKEADGNNTFEFVISTDEIDRDQDVINQSGWDLKAYRKNPVILFGHQHKILPIGRSIKTFQDGGKLKAIAEFTSADVNPMGDTVAKMIRGKFLRAASVGFQIKQGAWKESDDANRPFGWDIAKQELQEWSSVPVGSNRGALQGAKAAGINIETFVPFAEELLDTWHEKSGLWLSREQAEEMYKFCSGKGLSIQIPALEGVTSEKKDSEMEDEKKSILDSKEVRDAIADDIKNQGQIGASIAAEGQMEINKSILETLGSLTQTLKSLQESIKPFDPDQESAKAEEGSEDKGEASDEGDSQWKGILDALGEADAPQEEKPFDAPSELKEMINGAILEELQKTETAMTGRVF